MTHDEIHQLYMEIRDFIQNRPGSNQPAEIINLIRRAWTIRNAVYQLYLVAGAQVLDASNRRYAAYLQQQFKELQMEALFHDS